MTINGLHHRCFSRLFVFFNKFFSEDLWVTNTLNFRKIVFTSQSQKVAVNGTYTMLNIASLQLFRIWTSHVDIFLWVLHIFPLIFLKILRSNSFIKNCLQQKFLHVKYGKLSLNYDIPNLRFHSWL